MALKPKKIGGPRAEVEKTPEPKEPEAKVEAKEEGKTAEEPPYVTTSQFQDFQQRMMQSQQEAMMRGFGELASRFGQPQPAAPQGPPPVDYDALEATYAKAVEDGDGKTAAKVLRQIRAAEAQQRQVELQQMQEWGLQRIEAITANLPADGMPYYNDFKDEINAELARLDPSVRAHPQTRREAYNLVAGRNLGKIIEREVAARLAKLGEGQDDELLGSVLPGFSSRQAAVQREDEAPPLSDKAQNALARMQATTKRSNDELARMLGYPDWKTYRKRAAEQPQ